MDQDHVGRKFRTAFLHLFVSKSLGKGNQAKQYYCGDRSFYASFQ